MHVGANTTANGYFFTSRNKLLGKVSNVSVPKFDVVEILSGFQQVLLLSNSAQWLYLEEQEFVDDMEASRFVSIFEGRSDSLRLKQY